MRVPPARRMPKKIAVKIPKKLRKKIEQKGDKLIAKAQATFACL